MGSKGMEIDGVFASEAIDSSGEILDVAGCDISTLAIDGVLNYEHKGPDDKDENGRPKQSTNGEEVVGRIIFAKKIFKLADCSTDREKLFWSKVGKIPYIYGIARLRDAAGHSGAKALAAHIRDDHANNEPLLVRFSIEGTTLDKKGNILKESVARRVAATFKPCNRTALSGLLSDPEAPEGFDKKPTDDDEVQDLLAGIMDKSEVAPLFPHPMYTKLGGTHEFECEPIELKDSFRKSLEKLARLKFLQKALAAGNYNVAPSNLTGGAALQIEDRGLRMKRKAIGLLHDYDKDNFKKDEFRAFLKAKLPEADDSFVNHFADLADDYVVKLKGLRKAIDLEEDRIAEPQPDAKFPDPAKSKKPKVAESRITSGEPVAPVGGGGKNRLSMDESGNLTTPKGEELKFHAPNNDSYMSILNPDAYDISPEKRELYKRTVHEPWERAMGNWMELNKAMREGHLPRSIIKMAGLFSAMSPNTSVGLQERHYGHLMDMLHEGQMNINQPVTEDHIREFSRRAQGPSYPEWNRAHYEQHSPPPGVDDDEEAAVRAAKPNKWGNAKADLPQIMGLRHLDEMMPHLEHMVATHRDDARTMASKLMEMKTAHKQAQQADSTARRKGKPGDSQNQLDFPSVYGYGPKLSRYALSMMGGGNVIVPDRHMTRSMYNLGVDDPLSAYLATQVVTQSKNEPYLQALDRHFFNSHPAVPHVINKYPEHFKGHEEQAIFPAFWKHWLAIPHYEENQGRFNPSAANGGTDHQVYWDSIQDSMRRHGIPIRGEQYNYTPPDTSFDFGANMGKSEHDSSSQPMEHRALGALLDVKLKHGDTGASIAFYTHVLPALLDAEKLRQRRDPNAIIRKMQSLTIELRKASSDLKDKKAKESAEPVESPTWFAGNPVIRGSARAQDGNYDLLHEDDNHYVGVPRGTHQADFINTLKKFPKSKEGSHYVVYSRPSVHVSDL